MLKIEIEKKKLKDQSHPKLIFQTHDLGNEVRITS